MRTTVLGGFEWDTKVATANLSIFGLSFVEAATVFGSSDAFYFVNGSEHLVVGTSNLGKVITVSYAWYPRDWTPGVPSRCRILRASKATVPERRKLQP